MIEDTLVNIGPIGLISPIIIMPIKERRTKILLLLFLMGDVEYKTSPIDSRMQTIFDLSLNQKTKGSLASMIREGLIEKTEVDATAEKPVSTAYKLTNKGFYALCLEFPFFRFLKDEWDGRWRIISYEIPETKREIRDRLRREMRGWGLGPWHRSFWITPHTIVENLRDLVYGREEEKYIQAFESTHVFGDIDNLVEKVWGKVALDTQYRELFKKWHATLSEEKNAEEKMQNIIASYVEVLRVDPGLPESLVGRKWIGVEAYNIFREVRGILLK